MNLIDVRIDRPATGRIARQYDLDLIVLFGSRAKGRARPGSDIDVAVRKNRRTARPITAEEMDRDLALIGELVTAIQADDGDIDVVHELGIINDCLVYRFRQTYVGMRNRIIHDYERIDARVVFHAARRLLEDGRAYAEAVSNHLAHVDDSDAAQTEETLPDSTEGQAESSRR